MHDQKIYLFVLWFLNPDGSGAELTGGMERYCRDLARLMRSKGYIVEIYQKSHVPFVIDYESGIRVTGIPSSLSVRGHPSFYRQVCRQVHSDARVVFVSQDLCLGPYFANAVAVNHGIWWHGDFSILRKKVIRLHQYLMLRWLKAIICVDTNYINWMHAEFRKRELWRHKLSYICNYADTYIFHPKSEVIKNTEVLSIVFPRRMMGARIADEPRGGLLLLKAVKELKKRNPDLNFIVRMVGRGALTLQLKDWCEKNGLGNNVAFFEAGFDEMPDIYRNADIVVVPSTGTEGTSLSAIEGICSGATTVVSHIGGLGNVVIDGLNGYISDLSSESLCDALERAVHHPIRLRVPLKALGKERWDNQISAFLDRHIGMI